MFYRFARGLFRFLFVVFCRWEVEGLENIPVDGSLIVVANHVSYWDPIALGCALHRQVYFMAKKELFSYPLFGSVLKWLGAFPVNRGTPDRSALKRAFNLLRDGKIVGIFPEGTRSKTGEMLPPYGGAVYLALRTKAPVCPVALIGTDKIFHRGLFRKFKVRIGKPIFMEQTGKEDLHATAEFVMERIKELSGLPEDQEGILN